jgi:hypothetical protein
MEGHKAAHGIVLRKITSHTALAWNKLGDFLQQQTTGSVTRPLNHRTHVHLLGNKSPVRDEVSIGDRICGGHSHNGAADHLS